MLSSKNDDSLGRCGVDVRINTHGKDGRIAQGDALLAKLNIFIMTVNCAAEALETTMPGDHIIYYIDYPDSESSKKRWKMLASLGYKIMVVRTKYAPL